MVQVRKLTLLCPVPTFILCSWSPSFAESESLSLLSSLNRSIRNVSSVAYCCLLFWTIVCEALLARLAAALAQPYVYHFQSPEPKPQYAPGQIPGCWLPWRCQAGNGSEGWLPRFFQHESTTQQHARSIKRSAPLRAAQDPRLQGLYFHNRTPNTSIQPVVSAKCIQVSPCPSALPAMVTAHLIFCPTCPRETGRSTLSTCGFSLNTPRV